MVGGGGGEPVPLDLDDSGRSDRGAHQVDAQQKNIIPDMVGETASYFRNVIPWTDSLEPSPYRILDGQRLLLAGRLQPVRHCRRWSEPEACEVSHVVLKLVRCLWTRQ